jgi:hypothetical protein
MQTNSGLAFELSDSSDKRISKVDQLIKKYL